LSEKGEVVGGRIRKKTAGFRDETVDDLVVLALLYTDLLEIAPVP
jgi:hypothetical protein